MQLLSINVSQPREIEYNDAIIKTGIFKQAVDGPVSITDTNVSGDAQVDLKNHGGEHKAVYAFSANHYDFWRNKLDQPDLHFGQFGENLTITDLDEANLCIGDQLQVGGSILEITQPRVPCFKLGIAMNLKTMPKLFIEHAATGIYFRIIQPGTINVNDEVSLIKQHPEQLPVKTLFKAYFDKAFENPLAVMQRAETIAELSDEWREKVLSRLN